MHTCNATDSLLQWTWCCSAQAYSSQGQPKQEDREKIQWVRFEQADINGEYRSSGCIIGSGAKSACKKQVSFQRVALADTNSNPDCTNRSGNLAPLLLVLGYTNGVQIWTLPVGLDWHLEGGARYPSTPRCASLKVGYNMWLFICFLVTIVLVLQASGEAQEVLSIRQGPVRILRLLPSPESGQRFERCTTVCSKWWNIQLHCSQVCFKFVSAFDRQDGFANKRPLVVMCDASRWERCFVWQDLFSLSLPAAQLLSMFYFSFFFPQCWSAILFSEVCLTEIRGWTEEHSFQVSSSGHQVQFKVSWIKLFML